jgi:hypothetical protein
MTDDHQHGQDIHIRADGSREYRDPWVVVSDDALHGQHSGAVCVHAPSTFEIGPRGQLSGSLRLQPGSSARIAGQHSGSLHVAADAVVEVTGCQSGSVHVDSGGLVRVHAGGKLAGSLYVSGLIENRGTRGGSVDMNGGALLDLDGASVKQPATSSDGTKTYVW